MTSFNPVQFRSSFIVVAESESPSIALFISRVLPSYGVVDEVLVDLHYVGV